MLLVSFVAITTAKSQWLTALNIHASSYRSALLLGSSHFRTQADGTILISDTTFLGWKLGMPLKTTQTSYTSHPLTFC